jgi:hypothetical protein
LLYHFKVTQVTGLLLLGGVRFCYWVFGFVAGGGFTIRRQLGNWTHRDLSDYDGDCYGLGAYADGYESVSGRHW